MPGVGGILGFARNPRFFDRLYPASAPGDRASTPALTEGNVEGLLKICPGHRRIPGQARLKAAQQDALL